MNIGERIITSLGGMIAKDGDEIKKRSFEAGLKAGYDMADGNDEKSLLFTADGKPLGHGYKMVGTTPRDLSSVSQEKAINAAYRLWNSNPLAGALIEIIVDYVIGNGVIVTSENEDIQNLLNKFLSDPVNDFIGEDGSVGGGLEAIVRELSLFGEQLILTFVRDGADKKILGDGRVRIGTIDPSLIYSIITDPLNRKDILGVRIKNAQGGNDGPIYKIIKEDENGGPLVGRKKLNKYREIIIGANSENRTMRYIENELERNRDIIEPYIIGKEWIVCENDAGKLRIEAVNEDERSLFKPTGECFLFQVNKISTGVRGRPDILRMIDWMDRFDQLFFDGAEHVALLNAFAWDLEIKGGSEKSENSDMNLKMQAEKVSKLRAGSVYSHNENVVLEPKNPDLKTMDIETIIRQLRILIAGGARIPEHWLGEGSRANRATAEVMGEPTFRMLTRRQAYVRGILRKLCQYQIDVAVELGILPPEVDKYDDTGKLIGKIATRQSFYVDMPDINIEDTDIGAGAFAKVAQSVVTVTAMGLLTKRDAVSLLSATAKLIGVNIDVEETLNGISEEEMANPKYDSKSIKELIDYLQTGSELEETGNANG